MSGVSRQVLIGAMIAASIVAAQPAAAAPVAPSEVASQPAPAPEPAMLMLRPVCSTGDMHRFAVDNTAGPATRFTVAIDGQQAGADLRVGAGRTRHFWVDAVLSGPVEIVWADGSASATPVDEPCPAPRNAPSSSPSTTPAPPAAQPSPAPSAPDRQPGQRARGEAAASPAPPATAPPRPDAAVERSEGVPRPRPSGTAFACPRGWLPVDSDGDHRVDTSDTCEVVVETGAQGQSAPTAWPAAALVITVVLLIASIMLGTVLRRTS